MKCKYCKGELKLTRFVKETFEGGYDERVVWSCEECKVITSPQITMLMPESDQEKEAIRELYFKLMGGEK